MNFAWNALERKFAALIWTAADINQELGELLTADLGNISAAALFVNLLKRELSQEADDSLLDQGTKTVAVFDAIRCGRNDMIHSFYYRDASGGIDGYFKITSKNKTGQAEIKTVAMSKPDLDTLCEGISVCFESMNDLVHKLHFRRRFLAGERGAFSQNYAQAVHGWQEPSFDIERLRTFLREHSQRLNPPQGPPQPQSSRG